MLSCLSWFIDYCLYNSTKLFFRIVVNCFSRHKSADKSLSVEVDTGFVSRSVGICLVGRCRSTISLFCNRSDKTLFSYKMFSSFETTSLTCHDDCR
jgi:hypothetical protein